MAEKLTPLTEDEIKAIVELYNRFPPLLETETERRLILAWAEATAEKESAQHGTHHLSFKPYSGNSVHHYERCSHEIDWLKAVKDRIGWKD